MVEENDSPFMPDAKNPLRGAGGTSGGIGMFLLGSVMMIGGFYLLLNAIVVNSRFGAGMRLYSVGGFGITTGMVLIPLIFGIVFIFYDSSSVIGWLLAIGSLVALVFGVLSTVNFSLRTMSAFDLIVILVLGFGGLGLFMRSLKSAEPPALKP